jgi:Zn-dependent oligopeptidase
VEQWDHRFAVNELKRTSFAVDDLEVAAYFPLQSCLDGLFELMQEVLGVRFLEVDAPAWHPDVRAYDITEADGGEPFARFFKKIHDLHGLAFPEGTHRQSGFEHLFGYEAGYYGYLWSRTLADDMYTRFQAAGPLDPELGLTYRRTVLEPGGVDATRLVRDFLGRGPDHRAFLHNLGLAPDPEPAAAG